MKSTSRTTICLKNEWFLQIYLDVDLGEDLNGHNSTSGYVFTLGEIAISWMLRLQKSVYLSNTKAKYMTVL